jgi:hypothetical protein
MHKMRFIGSVRLPNGSGHFVDLQLHPIATSALTGAEQLDAHLPIASCT